MGTNGTPVCPSCGRPVADGAALCPYCGEAMRDAGVLTRLAPWRVFAALLTVAAALSAAFGFPLELQSLPPLAGEAFGIPSSRWPDALPALLRGLAALLVFLPATRRTTGVPVPAGAGEIVAGIAWRLLLLADGAIGAALCGESTPQLLFGLFMLLVCAAACRAFRLGLAPIASLALLASAHFLA